MSFTTQELIERRSYIGGSEVGAIMGFNKYQSPLDVYTEKVSEEEPEQIDNDFMLCGREGEEMCARLYTHKTGRRVVRDNKLLTNTRYPLWAGHRDRRIVASDDGYGVGTMEIKRPGANVTWEHDYDICYYCQLQVYLALAGNKWGVVFILKGGNQIIIHREERNDEFIAEMYAVCEKFWHEHVIPRVPPPLTTQADLDRYGNPTEESIEATAGTVEIVQEINRLTDITKQVTGKCEPLKLQIKLLLAGHNCLTRDGDTIATYKANKNGARRLHVKHE